MSQAHKKQLTRAELKEKALEWFQPAHANFLIEKDNSGDEDGAGAIVASVAMAFVPLVAMLLK